MQKSAYEIYNYLDELDLLKKSPEFWWPNTGTFEVVVGAILTQNTTWKNVEKSLENLKGFLELESFVSLREDALKVRIKPSGFQNQKAPRLLQLARNIKEEFITFEHFQKNVTRKWLLSQKGIGEESADAILCYGCMREEMVVDSYTKRLLKEFDIEFKKYAEYKTFLESSLREHCKEDELFRVFAEFHGMIVEYNKQKDK
ncbi:MULTISPECIES: 3-methyladenine DNA glycosylase [Sulfurimonas]|uniref:3-methyladenine DNA glycosylase n=1 Tax=Sulfurimonas TaxID=202746 RepID=UPI0012644585|nr:3-methyladenine DNA glycosylase [Sulfurimonas indica]